MSVDTKLYLPPGTRYDDFCDVLSALLGAETSAVSLTNGGSYTDVTPNLEYRHTHTPEMITLTGDIHGANVYGYWFFTVSDHSGPMFMTGYREERRPVFEALVYFFGGRLDMSDCDDIATDYKTNKQHRNRADDSAWRKLQAAKLAVTQVAGPDKWNHR